MTPISRLVSALDAAQDAETRALDVACDVIAEGISLNEIGRTLQRTRQSVVERFVPGQVMKEADRIGARARLWRGSKLHGVRVSSWGRYVVFDDGSMYDHHDAASVWRIIRHCDLPDRAQVIALYVAERGTDFRYVRRPRDLEVPMPWAYPGSRHN